MMYNIICYREIYIYIYIYIYIHTHTHIYIYIYIYIYIWLCIGTYKWNLYQYIILSLLQVILIRDKVWDTNFLSYFAFNVPYIPIYISYTYIRVYFESSNIFFVLHSIKSFVLNSVTRYRSLKVRFKYIHTIEHKRMNERDDGRAR